MPRTNSFADSFDLRGTIYDLDATEDNPYGDYGSEDRLTFYCSVSLPEHPESFNPCSDHILESTLRNLFRDLGISAGEAESIHSVPVEPNQDRAALWEVIAGRLSECGSRHLHYRGDPQ